MKRLIWSGIAALFLYACGGGHMSISLPTPSTAEAQTSCATQFGTFAVSATGFSSTVSGTVPYKLWPCDKRAEIYLPPLSGASNANTFTIGPLPTALVPASIAYQEHLLAGFDNNTEVAGLSVQIRSGDTTIRVLKLGNENGWTASSNKGVGIQVIPIWLD